jgi:hypothetical protein
MLRFCRQILAERDLGLFLPRQQFIQFQCHHFAFHNEVGSGAISADEAKDARWAWSESNRVLCECIASSALSFYPCHKQTDEQ